MDVIKDLESKLQGIAVALKQEFAGIRTNRPTTKLVEDIKVDYFGQQMPVKALGSIGIMPPREIDINVWDKNALAAVVKAIEDSKIGLTPNTDGNLIRLNLPVLTDERRRELEKLVKNLVEQARIKVRGFRDDANKRVEQDFKDKKIGEDQKFKNREQVQKAVDKTNVEIENLLLGKIKEING